LSIWFTGMRPQFRTIDGLSIRFAESEDDHALLLSPWPESLFALSAIMTAARGGHACTLRRQR
jgi:hypothetical protein